MRPTRLSSNIFLELPPVLSHYLERSRNLWLHSSPQDGQLSLLDRLGVFVDIEALAVERRQLIGILGHHRAKALSYRIGFEQGRREAARHFSSFQHNTQVALQAGPLFAQLRGEFVAMCRQFEFDIPKKTLYRELVLRRSAEALAHQMVEDAPGECVCWSTAGYLSGHVSEILGRRVVTIEQECLAKGAEACTFVSRLDLEWGSEAQWAREAFNMPSVEEEIRDRESLLSRAKQVVAQAQVAASKPKQQRGSPLQLDQLVAESDSMQSVVRRANQLASTDLPVLLSGDSGVGRETLARAIHLAGARRNGPFSLLDCTGMSQETLDRQLFGFVKGAFPGATRSYVGLLVQADRGTVYINEIGALSFEAQGILSRVLQDSRVQPLGADDFVETNVRLIAATQFDLREQTASGGFRDDLYYAIGVGHIDLPPLCERRADILPLAAVFLREFRDRYDRPGVVFSDEAKAALLDCTWPGNVRQLRNVVEHAVVFCQKTVLGLGDLPEEALVSDWKRPPRDLSREVVMAVLRRARGNRTRAAEFLGVGRTTLWRIMRRFGIEQEENR